MLHTNQLTALVKAKSSLMELLKVYKHDTLKGKCITKILSLLNTYFVDYQNILNKKEVKTWKPQ